MQASIGDIKITRMIWLQTILILGSLAFCFINSNYSLSPLPSIVDIAKLYPNSIVFRIGMLYSMFLLFLQICFIKWWLNAVNRKCLNLYRIYPFNWLGLASVMSYGIFASCIDNAKMSFELIAFSVTVAFFCFCSLINLISLTIWNLKKGHKDFISETSWNYKKWLTIVNIILSIIGVTIFIGFIDINYKVILEYLILFNTVGYFWTFTLDFKQQTMGVQDSKYDQKNIQKDSDKSIILSEILQK